MLLPTTLRSSRRARLSRSAAVTARGTLVKGWLARVLTPNAYLF
jgi:hypothetical protein